MSANLTHNQPQESMTPFICRFDASQQRLMIALFRDAARQRDANRPSAVCKHVASALSKYVLRSLGESSAETYAHSLQVLHDFKAQAEAFAGDALTSIGKTNAAKRGGLL